MNEKKNDIKREKKDTMIFSSHTIYTFHILPQGRGSHFFFLRLLFFFYFFSFT